jgi:HK97 family phage portal protein
MGVWQRAWSWLAKRFAPTQKGRGERVFARMLAGGGPLSFPGAWTQDRAEQVRHFHGWNYVAIRAIAEEFAGKPPTIAVRRRPEEARARQEKGFSLLDGRRRKKALTVVPSHEELELLDRDHRLVQLLEHPNDCDTSWEFWYRTLMYLELTGNAFWWLVPDELGLPCELWILPSQWVWPRWDRKPGHLIDYYDVRPYGGAVGSGFRIPADQIVPIQYPHPLTPFDGYSPQTAGAEWIDLGESIDAARWASFKEGARPGLILKLGPEFHDPDEALIQRIRARIEEVYVGERNTGRPLILPPGCEADTQSRSPGEMDYNSSGDQMMQWQLALHRVGKTIAGITEDVQRSNMDAGTANFVLRTIRPKRQLIGQKATQRLARLFDERLVIFWEEDDVDDPELRLRQHTTYLDKGILTINEVRHELGREPYPHGGDDPLLPMSASPMPWVSGEDLEEEGTDFPARAGGTSGPAGRNGAVKPSSPGTVQRNGASGRNVRTFGTSGPSGRNGAVEPSPTQPPVTPPGQEPIEQTEQRAKLLSTLGGISGVLEIVGQVAQGAISQQTAIELLKLFFGMAADQAAKLLGDAAERAQQAQVPPPQPAGPGLPPSLVPGGEPAQTKGLDLRDRIPSLARTRRVERDERGLIVRIVDEE